MISVWSECSLFLSLSIGVNLMGILKAKRLTSNIEEGVRFPLIAKFCFFPSPTKISIFWALIFQYSNEKQCEQARAKTLLLLFPIPIAEDYSEFPFDSKTSDIKKNFPFPAISGSTSFFFPFLIRYFRRFNPFTLLSQMSKCCIRFMG